METLPKMPGYLDGAELPLYVMADAAMIHPVMCALRAQAEASGYTPRLIPYSPHYVTLDWTDASFFLLDPGLSLERLYLAEEARARRVPTTLLIDVWHPFTDAQWLALQRFSYVQKYSNVCLVEEILLHVEEAMHVAQNMRVS